EDNCIAEDYGKCTWGGTKCCRGRPCRCSMIGTNCECTPRLIMEGLSFA
nr:omega-Aga-TK=P-type calcium channel blocker [Agelenopsis aperta, venom, Peptide, 48 aa] [Agelenopsis aperta]1AGG_A Chain A, OMEGA-AGATOXIN-IVB [Agelenopsis aperta]1OMA_A Chain A, OMEGA-AGA-IVB [Agelenopsis aperta]1OMB_A Chain A, OMEGA-AGA-IVB [Agelenopsis aperta]prf//2108381A omega-agatoxin TK [Agelenopsis aperta]